MLETFNNHIPRFFAFFSAARLRSRHYSNLLTSQNSSDFFHAVAHIYPSLTGLLRSGSMTARLTTMMRSSIVLALQLYGIRGSQRHSYTKDTTSSSRSHVASALFALYEGRVCHLMEELIKG
jgi:hypothetical protein